MVYNRDPRLVLEGVLVLSRQGKLNKMWPRPIDLSYVVPGRLYEKITDTGNSIWKIVMDIIRVEFLGVNVD